MSAKSELIAARAIIAEQGRVANGLYYDRKNKCACMAGAVLLARGHTVRREGQFFDDSAGGTINMDDPATAALVRAIGVNSDEPDSWKVHQIFHFNDDHADDIPAILAKFDEAIAIAED